MLLFLFLACQPIISYENLITAAQEYAGPDSKVNGCSETLGGYYCDVTTAPGETLRLYCSYISEGVVSCVQR